MKLPKVESSPRLAALLAALGPPEGYRVGNMGPLPLKAALAFARLLAAAGGRTVPVHASWACGRKEEAALVHAPGGKRR